MVIDILQAFCLKKTGNRKDVEDMFEKLYTDEIKVKEGIQLLI